MTVILMSLGYEPLTCGKGSPEWTRTTNPASQDRHARSSPVVAGFPSTVGIPAVVCPLWALVSSRRPRSFGMDKPGSDLDPHGTDGRRGSTARRAASGSRACPHSCRAFRRWTAVKAAWAPNRRPGLGRGLDRRPAAERTIGRWEGLPGRERDGQPATGRRLSCLMTIPSLLGSVVLLAMGAALGFVPTYLNERAKRRHDLATRWDVPLYQLCVEYAATARLLVHLCRCIGRSEDNANHAAKIEEQHIKLRTLLFQVRLIGDRYVQDAAWRVADHAYAVRKAAEEPRTTPADPDAEPPDLLMMRAVTEFVVSARHQLGVNNPDDVIEDSLFLGQPSTGGHAAKSQ